MRNIDLGTYASIAPGYAVNRWKKNAQYLKSEKAVVCWGEPRTAGSLAVQKKKCYLQECSVQTILKPVGGPNLPPQNVSLACGLI